MRGIRGGLYIFNVLINVPEAVFKSLAIYVNRSCSQYLCYAVPAREILYLAISSETGLAVEPERKVSPLQCWYHFSFSRLASSAVRHSLSSLLVLKDVQDSGASITSN